MVEVDGSFNLATEYADVTEWFTESFHIFKQCVLTLCTLMTLWLK